RSTRTCRSTSPDHPPLLALSRTDAVITAPVRDKAGVFGSTTGSIEHDRGAHPPDDLARIGPHVVVGDLDDGEAVGLEVLDPQRVRLAVDQRAVVAPALDLDHDAGADDESV